MEKFLKENWFKISATVIMFVVALSVAYYFVIFLPKNKLAEILSENQSACSEISDKTLLEYKKNTLEIGGKISGFESTSNHYNTKLKKCIVEISDSSSVGNTLMNYITVMDGVENKNLLWCAISRQIGRPEDDSCINYESNINGDEITKAKFDLLEKQYLTE